MTSATQKNKHQSLILLERHIDPRQKTIGFLEIARANLVAAGLGAERDSPELDRARRAIVPLVRMGQSLNKAAFWPFVYVPVAHRAQVAESTQDERSEFLQAAREQLLGRDITRADIVGAVDSLHGVVTAMNNMFTVGKIKGHDEPDDAWALDRFECASLLPALVEGLDNFWHRLHQSRCAGE